MVPAARALIGLESREILDEREQTQQAEFGERAGVDAAGARDRHPSQFLAGQFSRAHLLPGAGGRGLNPAQTRVGADRSG